MFTPWQPLQARCWPAAVLRLRFIAKADLASNEMTLAVCQKMQKLSNACVCYSPMECPVWIKTA